MWSLVTLPSDLRSHRSLYEEMVPVLATGEISRSKKTKTWDALTRWDECRQSRLEDEASILDWGSWFRP